jgi:hypothetical protein
MTKKLKILKNDKQTKRVYKRKTLKVNPIIKDEVIESTEFENIMTLIFILIIPLTLLTYFLLSGAN